MKDLDTSVKSIHFRQRSFFSNSFCIFSTFFEFNYSFNNREFSIFGRNTDCKTFIEILTVQGIDMMIQNKEI